MIDNEDWRTSCEFYNFMDELWGPYTVDRFASNFNFKVRRFNSNFWSNETEAVDAFFTQLVWGK